MTRQPPRSNPPGDSSRSRQPSPLSSSNYFTGWVVDKDTGDICPENSSYVSPPTKLLVVDDEEDFCEIVKQVAQSAGFEVTSTTEAELFHQYYSPQIKVIVLDLSMPNIDGIELIRFLSSIHSRASLILMSGFDSHILNSAKEVATNNGLHVLGTLKKPFAMAELQELLINVSAPTVSVSSSEDEEDYQFIGNLQQAIKDHELFVMYQPRIDLNTRALVGVEALARWKHPEKGLIPPSVFIDLAEKHAMIDEVTSIITEQALIQCAQWRADGLQVQLSINMSARTLKNLKFPDQLLAQVHDHNLHPSDIVIELTESSVMDELAKSLDILTRLRMKGFHLSIDDFGTGYSSMMQLQKIPFNELKIDQSFVMRSHANKESNAIVATTVDLGRRLGMTVVAEGIEKQIHWDLLQEMGCDQAQGYLMAKPMLGEELLYWNNSWT